MLGATAGDGSTDLTTSPITAAGKIFVQFQPSQAGTYDPTMPNFDAVIRLQ